MEGSNFSRSRLTNPAPRDSSRFTTVMCFTPARARWLNQVERFFAKITTQRIRWGTFENVRALETAIEAYLNHHNDHGKPLVWTATADAPEAVLAPRRPDQRTRDTGLEFLDMPVGPCNAERGHEMGSAL